MTEIWPEIWFSGRNSSLASTPGVAKPLLQVERVLRVGDAVDVAAQEQRFAPVQRVAAELDRGRRVAEVEAAEHEGVQQFAAAAAVQALHVAAVGVADVAGDPIQRAFGLEWLVLP